MVLENYPLKFRMNDLQCENYILGSQNAIQVCPQMVRVYGLLADTNVACREGKFTIPSLCIQVRYF